MPDDPKPLQMLTEAQADAQETLDRATAWCERCQTRFRAGDRLCVHLDPRTKKV